MSNQHVRKEKVYIIGPMRGIRHYNFEAFLTLAATLRKGGHPVRDPASMDIKAGLDARKLPDTTDWTALPKGFDFQACVKRDLAAVLWCDTILALPGWESSMGAPAEMAVAKWAGKRIVEQPTDGMKEPMAELLDDAKSLVTGSRQKDYSHPREDFRRTAAMWTGYLGLYNALEPKDVAWMMVMVKASRSKVTDKRDNYLDAAGYAACGWACVDK